MTLEKKPVGADRIIEEKKEDRISQLPDCLLCEILLNLPTKDVIKASLLCRRWSTVNATFVYGAPELDQNLSQNV
ncbi:hypothetical protein F2Q69_00063236 [Brassica cretica]|uniref:F-box domain-containing protein n=1 Tax=Brassica cretica TaxID=69181 RepID=A0A8S9RPR5_BRACR|nr:hypothetical protein F2Q69_00063236 [Brassica cretica]